jgi:hypothetical protein
MEYVILCQLKLSDSQFSASIDDLELFQPIPNSRDDSRGNFSINKYPAVLKVF